MRSAGTGFAAFAVFATAVPAAATAKLEQRSEHAHERKHEHL